MVIEYRVWGCRVLLKLPLVCLVDSVVDAISVSLQLPLVNGVVIKWLTLKRTLYLVVVIPVIFERLSVILLLY